MTTFLGAPVLVRGEAWGNIYLTEKDGGGEFDEADEQALVVLSGWVAIAIENAHLYEDIDAGAASSSEPSAGSRRLSRSPARSAARPTSTESSS